MLLCFVTTKLYCEYFTRQQFTCLNLIYSVPKVLNKIILLWLLKNNRAIHRTTYRGGRLLACYVKQNFYRIIKNIKILTFGDGSSPKQKIKKWVNVSTHHKYQHYPYKKLKSD